MTQVSIVTACFNSVTTLADTLASVAQQQGVTIEHLVLDGGSTDGSREMLRSRPWPGRLLIEEPDRGIYDALNKGFDRATGEVVGLLHADDVFEHPQVLAHVMAAFEDPTVDALYGDMVYVRRQDLSKVVRNWRSGQFRHSALRWGWMMPHTTVFMRRATWQRLGHFDLSYRIGADYEHMLRLLTNPSFTIRYLPERLVRMRVGGLSNQSIMSRISMNREDLRAIRKHQVGGIHTIVAKVLRKLPQYC